MIRSRTYRRVEMYLSRVVIDKNNRKKIKDLTHVGAYHAWVEDSFPEEHGLEERTRKLWRIDYLNDNAYLLLVSPNQPSLELLEKYGVENSAESKEYSPFLASLHNGMKLNFRVTLNPVISKSIPNSHQRGRVLPHISLEHQRKFLLDRSKVNGFDLQEEAFTIVERGYALFKKKGQKDLRLVKVTYEGVLTVIDEQRFREILIKGLGKKKAYGFGLMTVIPYR